MSTTKSTNAFQIKDQLPEYIIPARVNRNNYVIPKALEEVKESEWGWHNTILARFLCPMVLVGKFDKDPEYVFLYHYICFVLPLITSREFRAQVLAGDIGISGFDWPVFCYDESKYDPSNPNKGLLKGYVLLCVYRHIFTGPRTALGGKPTGRRAHGALNNLTKPTPKTIGYAAIVVCVYMLLELVLILLRHAGP